jgi:hypothetical protein
MSRSEVAGWLFYAMSTLMLVAAWLFAMVARDHARQYRRWCLEQREHDRRVLAEWQRIHDEAFGRASPRPATPREPTA